MAKYTATLNTQSTAVKVCDVHQPRMGESWFANAMASGTFGGGTVSWGLSFDAGTTIYPLNQDGTATAATQTAIGALNLRVGYANKILANEPAGLYASVGSATNPSIALIVLDNR